MVRNNPARDRQPKSSAIFASREIRREQPLAIIRCDPPAGIGDGQPRHRLVANEFAAQNQFLDGFTAERLERVVQQIDQHALHLQRVHQNRR